MKWLQLMLFAGLILCLCLLLPRLAAAPFMEVVRSNIERDIDATAYFYSDLDDFSQYEEGLPGNR